MTHRAGARRGGSEGQAGLARPAAKLQVTSLPQSPTQWAKHRELGVQRGIYSSLQSLGGRLDISCWTESANRQCRALGRTNQNFVAEVGEVTEKL